MIAKEFNPSLFHPYYFIRSRLLKSVKAQAHNLQGRLLDFGCGSKPYKSLFTVEEYIGVDFVNEGHPHDNEQIDVYYDGSKLPFPDNSFDSILCSEVFEHIFNLPEILSELNRVLKPGGKILVTCPFVWKEHELPHDYARYTLFALTDLFNKSRFDILVKDKSGNFVQVISQLLVLYFLDTAYSKVKGKVEDTIPSVLPDKISLLRLDTDWYESTKHELTHLFPKLVKGGVLIIDDYGFWKGARKAVDEYFAENNIQILLNRLDGTGRIAVKLS